MPSKRSEGKIAQSPAARGSDRTPAAQPPPTKKLKYDQPTSAQPPAGGSDHTHVAQSPPAVESNLELLQKFWHSAWGKEDAFKASQQGLDGNSFDYLDFGAHFKAVRKICDAVPKKDGKLCILEEYIEAYARFDETDKVYEEGACIIGQPGIGKSCFIAYAVVQRLRKKLPVAVEWYHKSVEQYWLFTADGVSLESDETPLRQHPGIWAFSDSDADVFKPTTAFRKTDGVRTFQATSPQEVRYKQWTKYAKVNFYYMDLPSKQDIVNISLVGGKDTMRMKHLAKKWGPALRILDIIHDDPHVEECYEESVTTQLKSDVKQLVNVLTALNDSGGPNTIKESSSTIFFIRPRRREEGLDRQYFNVSIPTYWLQDKVIDALRQREQGQKRKMFNALLGILGAASGIFERIIHTYFVNHTELDVRWYSHGKLGPPERLAFGRLTALPAKQDLKLAPLPCYRRPRESNFATIDCAILTNDLVYAIQATTAATYLIGYTEKQTECVVKDLVRKMNTEGVVGLRVGGVTFGCNIIDELEVHSTEADELFGDE